MADVREAILMRLTLASKVAGIKSAWRNNINLDDLDPPATVILDGEEEVDPNIIERNVPNMTPMRVFLRPQVSIIVNEKTVNVGAVLGGFRALLVPTILQDEALIALSGSGGSSANGAIRYLGCAPSFEEGRLLIGQLSLRFQISYIFDPSDL